MTQSADREPADTARHPRELPDPEFWIEEEPDDGDPVRLGLIGELDIAGADRLRYRLEALAERRRPVRLDLRRLQFIDSSGLRELVRAVSDARRDGWVLELDPTLSPQVSQVIDLLELRRLFWPQA
jgi:anti-anti-sigma factor